MLTEEQIQKMAVEFCITCNEEKKQTLVDQLGLNPLNHFLFGLFVADFCGKNITQTYAKYSYLDKTRYLKEKNYVS